MNLKKRCFDGINWIEPVERHW